MTESEVIEYLKQNKKLYKPFHAMPREVQGWCIWHSEEKIFRSLEQYGWSKELTSILCCTTCVYCLD